MSISSYVGQILIYTISGITVTILTVLGTRQVKARGSKARMEKMLNLISVTLLGEDATPFNPSPGPGLIRRMELYRQESVDREIIGDGLIKEFATQKKTVNDLVSKVDSIHADVKSLIKDSRAGDGSTSKDAQERMEESLGSNPDHK